MPGALLARDSNEKTARPVSAVFTSVHPVVFSPEILFSLNMNKYAHGIFLELYLNNFSTSPRSFSFLPAVHIQIVAWLT